MPCGFLLRLHGDYGSVRGKLVSRMGEPRGELHAVPMSERPSIILLLHALGALTMHYPLADSR